MNIQKACQILNLDMNDPDLQQKAKTTYRCLVKLVHPDKSQSDTAEMFQAVKEAYDFIKEYVPIPQSVNTGIIFGSTQQGHFGTHFTVHASQDMNVSQTTDANGHVHTVFTFIM